MSTRPHRFGTTLLAFLSLAAGCVGQVTSGQAPPGSEPADADPGAPPESDAGGDPTGESTRLALAKVAITALPGASEGAGLEGTFVAGSIVPTVGTAPSLSNSVLSAVPGAPPKPLFVGANRPMDAVLVGLAGHDGYFEVAAGGHSTIGLDVVTQASAALGPVTLVIAVRNGQNVSETSTVQLFVDDHRFVAAGDLENHDSDGSNIADLFGAYLEGKAGHPATPVQVLDGTDNNQIIVDGVKGPSGTQPTGHREVVWDGVPEALRNRPDFNPEFFDRQDQGTAGVRGGIVFRSTGAGQEVNDAFAGAIPDAALVGPPANENAPVGGDFSNIASVYSGNLLAFTQSASFAPLGSTTTEITFRVPGSQDRAVVHGLGIVFSSVDKPNSSYVEYFDEAGNVVAKIFSPVQDQGRFPFEGPAIAERFSYTFVGYNDASKRIARVVVVSGDVPVDEAQGDFPAIPGDVAIFDDVYYSEPEL
jgi:hypothetical protein